MLFAVIALLVSLPIFWCYQTKSALRAWESISNSRFTRETSIWGLNSGDLTCRSFVVYSVGVLQLWISLQASFCFIKNQFRKVQTYLYALCEMLHILTVASKTIFSPWLHVLQLYVMKWMIGAFGCQTEIFLLKLGHGCWGIWKL